MKNTYLIILSLIFAITLNAQETADTTSKSSKIGLSIGLALNPFGMPSSKSYLNTLNSYNQAGQALHNSYNGKSVGLTQL